MCVAGSGSRKGKLCSYWQYNSKHILWMIFSSLGPNSPLRLSKSTVFAKSARFTHSKHCHVSLSSGNELIAGMWQFWWKTFGHLSQHISSPPSKQTAHQSSFGSSFWSVLSAKWKKVRIYCRKHEKEENCEHLPSAMFAISVELCTCGDVVLFRPSGRTWTPFESSFAIVAIRSFIESSRTLSIGSVKSFEVCKYAQLVRSDL